MYTYRKQRSLITFQAGDLDIGGNWRPHPFDWIYQGPAVVVLVVNVIFLIIIMWVSKFLNLSWVIAYTIHKLLPVT